MENYLYNAVDIVRERLFNIEEWYKERERRQYLARKKSQLKNLDFSIISSNCNGAFLYKDLNRPYLTPTVNLSIDMRDFVKMAGNLRWYMEQEMVEVVGENDCPKGLLGDITIHFVHYQSFEEGVRKWEERKRRINWNNLFLMGTERGECGYEVIKKFDGLPYKNKVVFTHVEYPEFSSAYYIKGFEEQGQLGVLLRYKKQFLRRRYLDDFDYVSFLNGSDSF